MQAPNKPFGTAPKHTGRKIFISVLVFVLIAAVTVGVLYALKPGSDDEAVKNGPTTNAAASSTTPNAKETIAKVETAVTEQKIAGEIPSVVTSDGSQALYVTLKETNNYVDVIGGTALHLGGITFNEQQTNAAVAGLTKQLTDMGYEASRPDIPSVRTLFTSKNGSCQISLSTTAPQNTTAMIDVLCADAIAYQANVSERLALLKTAGVEQNSFTYTQTARADVDGQQAEMISVFKADKTLSGAYVYGKAGESWEYVGNSAAGTPVAGTSTEKFTINAEIQKGIDNAQYGKAVARLVGGSSGEK